MSASQGSPTASQLTMNGVTIGILTALEEEYAACRGVFDPRGEGSLKSTRSNSGPFNCWLCAVPAPDDSEHVIAILMLPGMGNNSAAIGASNLLHYCPNVKFLIMCGIAGAVPNPSKAEEHVRLGDIVVTDENGVIQYDRGKQRDPRIVSRALDGEELRSLSGIRRLLRFFGELLPRYLGVGRQIASVERNQVSDPFVGFECRHPPRAPSCELLDVVRQLRAEELLGQTGLRRWDALVSEYIASRGNSELWRRPESSSDRLIDSPTLAQSAVVPHPKDWDRRVGHPRVFLGPIGAANIVQADPSRRDSLRDRYGIKAVEMEGSGIADVSWVAAREYLVVRGTCDYCNSSKNDVWRRYAALIAAAYARAIVERVPQIAGNAARPESAYGPTLESRLPGAPIRSAPRSKDEPVGVDVSATTRKPAQRYAHAFEASVAIPDTDTIRAVTVESPGQDASSTSMIFGPNSNAVRLGELVSSIDDLLKQERWTDCDALAQQLEKELVSCQRRGMAVRRGWILLARIECRRLLNDKQAGRAVDTTRLRRLREEAENVVD